jgi:hypothetical protein
MILCDQSTTAKEALPDEQQRNDGNKRRREEAENNLNEEKKCVNITSSNFSVSQRQYAAGINE